MTKKRMLGMVNSKRISKFIKAAELPKSVFPRSLKNRLGHDDNNDQHSRAQLRYRREAFQDKEIKKENPQRMITYISHMLFMENKYYIDSTFLFFVDPVIEDKVNSDMRDYTVKNLQIMNKVFFELPIDILVKGVTLVDRFITRVKVKPKYMSCVAIACFYIAAKTAEPTRVKCPSMESLSQISMCGGTVQDLERMVDIVMIKLDRSFDFVTSYDFLSFFHNIRASDRLGNWPKLTGYLEIAQTTLKVCCQKPSVVALACLLVNPRDNDLTFVKSMAVVCKIDMKNVTTTAEIITELNRVSYCRQPSSRSSLVWAISKRTMSKICTATPATLTKIDEEDAHGETSDNVSDSGTSNRDSSSSSDSLFHGDKQ